MLTSLRLCHDSQRGHVVLLQLHDGDGRTDL